MKVNKMIYYWESEDGCDTFCAANDEEAKQKKTELEKDMDIWIVYRESEETRSGLPFIEIK